MHTNTFFGPCQTVDLHPLLDSDERVIWSYSQNLRLCMAYNMSSINIYGCIRRTHCWFLSRLNVLLQKMKDIDWGI